ncbi:hypothetical protein PYCCODRAFT_1470742 [Trametes coccinea BRFM310]|uniref:Uncharacterized protein n=1 Tax=Trametes coccinea (strain BRFM310) TaxID=1353009 RepID=A0A1Y2IDK7_TRAC3|nr:hypothetical protein PYCCODRAFT_1470742 [Trametes coccinea BRFM310]
MPRFMYALNKAPRKREKTTGFNLFSVFVREFVSRGDDNRAHLMAQRASPYWHALTASQRRYWQCRADEIFRSSSDDSERALLSSVPLPDDLMAHVGTFLAFPRLEPMPPSLGMFRDWYGEFTQSMLDLLSEILVSTTVEGYRARHSTSPRPVGEKTAAHPSPKSKSAGARKRPKPPSFKVRRVRGVPQEGPTVVRRAGRKPTNRPLRQRSSVNPSTSHTPEQENTSPPPPALTFAPAIPAMWYDPGSSARYTNTTACRPSAAHWTPSITPPLHFAEDPSFNFASSATSHTTVPQPPDPAWPSTETWETSGVSWGALEHGGDTLPLPPVLESNHDNVAWTDWEHLVGGGE